MFFKTLKQKSSQRFLDNTLQNKRSLEGDISGKISKVACIAHQSLSQEVEDFKAYFHDLGVHVNNFHAVIYADEPRSDETFTNHFSSADFGWKGKVLDSTLREFLDRDYDLLLNLYQDDSLWPAKLASVLSKSKFSVGFATIDERVNDLSIHCNVRDVVPFQIELTKYLKALKKI